MKFKKIALVLAIMLFVTACAGEAPQLLSFLDDGTTEVDFEGMTFRIFHDADHDLRYVDETSNAASFRHEKLLARLDEVEQNYNCTIITHCGDDPDFPLNYGSGIPFADFVHFRLKNSYPMYLAGYFIPVDEIPTIDLYSGKYGSEELINTLTLPLGTLGFHATQWGQGPVGFSNAIVYNPEIYTMINQPTPNEYYEQGEWNWDALRTIGQACASISTPEFPVYLSPSNDYFFRMLVLSNGGEYIRENANGKFEYGLLDSRVSEALQFGHDMYNEGFLENGSGAHEVYVGKFAENMYSFMCEYSGYGVGDLISTSSGDLAGEMQSVGYCYMPDGPQAVDNTIGVLSNENSFYSVTKEKTEDVELLGHFMELLFAPLDEDPEEWIEEFKTMNFFDPMSAEVYMTQATNSYFDKVIFAFTNDTIFEAVEKAGKRGNIAEELQSIASLTNAQLDAGINAGK